MKLGVILAAATASAFAATTANASPFATPQSVVATKVGYQSVEYTIKNNDARTGIKVPVTGRPVHMMVTDTTSYFEGIGEVTLVANPGLSLMWIGTDLASNAGGTPVINHGSAQAKGTHIMWADGDETVNVQVQNETTIEIRNKSGESQTVIVTFTW